MNSRYCKFLVVVLILGFFFAPSAACAASEGGAIIKFDTVEHDFGKIAPDSYSDCNFPFTNTGKGVLEIDRVKGTCKCTVPALKKKEYAPGESGEITVKFHAPKYQGSTSQHIMVFSNDPNNSRVQLVIKAYVQTKVKASPEQLTLSLIAPDAGVSPITLTSLDGEKFAVTKVESPGNVVSIDFDPNEVLEKHIFNPVIDVNNLNKYLNGFIVFTLNHPSCKTIRVQYSCLKEFETSPSVIIIRNAVVGEIQKRTIYLTSNYNQPIEIESISSDNGIIKVVGKEQTENRFKFDVEVAPPLQDGKLRVFSDTLHIKIKDKEQLDISCRGFYKADK
ncbi:MAG: DUF1573 domain-containing protein [Planctomycetes bacterium]|nr:DUF1573 domain-containing protein [Planctomycetota bacterium]MBU1518148.1 DUF1573 domain-containing protein [Planctomycetota bacterium]MBU2457070.1 DUF1573 domain-containing protein [Planctomycetota bacterium]